MQMYLLPLSDAWQTVACFVNALGSHVLDWLGRVVMFVSRLHPSMASTEGIWNEFWDWGVHHKCYHLQLNEIILQHCSQFFHSTFLQLNSRLPGVFAESIWIPFWQHWVIAITLVDENMQTICSFHELHSLFVFPFPRCKQHDISRKIIIHIPIKHVNLEHFWLPDGDRHITAENVVVSLRKLASGPSFKLNAIR